MTTTLVTPAIGRPSRAAKTPTGVPLGRPSVHSRAWHELRAGGVGGSDVAPILGLSPWVSSYSLWHERANDWRTAENDAMHWGSALEPVIRREFAARHDWRVAEVGAYAHRARLWQRCNPDGLIVERRRITAGLEVKTARYGDDWGPSGTDQIPIYYRTQVVWCMDVTGLRRWHVAVLIAGADYREHVIEYDAEEARIIRGRCAAWWRSLLRGTPPDLDGSTATLQTVRRLHPDIDVSAVEVDPWTAVAWRIARRRQERAESATREATSRLLTQMGTARRALTPDGRPVARRQPARGGSVALYPVTTKESA